SPLTFTASNWNVPQTLTLGTVNDTVVEPSRSLSIGAAVTSADSVYQSTTPPAISLQLNDDDVATVAFTASTSQVVEQTGSHTVVVRLTIPGGGSLGQSLTVNIIDPKTGTAQSPADYSLSTTSVVFPAGATSGATQNVSLAIVSDTTTEPNETIQLQLQVPSSGLSNVVSLGTPSTTEVTIVDDPSTATLSGAVWIDVDGDKVRDASEAGVAGVRVTLSGTDVRSRTVQITTLTDSTGSYRFTNLPAGTYRITQAQPAALLDGPEVLGTVGGTASGTIEADSFKDVVLSAGAAAINYNFSEGTLQQTMVTRRLFVASQILGTNYVRNVIAAGEQAAGNSAQADVVRQGQSFEVRRIGTNVDVTTTGAATNVVFTPAKSQQAVDATKHVVQVSGVNLDFPAVDVRNFVFRGNGNVATTRDQITFQDSTANDKLETDGNRAVISSDDYRAEAIAFELVKAISKSGGTDTRESISAIDYVLELEGSWT
ncbi:MAG: Calx-beta domain-containing protein, partial [Planctomycetota bacterium]